MGYSAHAIPLLPLGLSRADQEAAEDCLMEVQASGFHAGR